MGVQSSDVPSGDAGGAIGTVADVVFKGILGGPCEIVPGSGLNGVAEGTSGVVAGTLDGVAGGPSGVVAGILSEEMLAVDGILSKQIKPVGIPLLSYRRTCVVGNSTFLSPSMLLPLLALLAVVYCESVGELDPQYDILDPHYRH